MDRPMTPGTSARNALASRQPIRANPMRSLYRTRSAAGHPFRAVALAAVALSMLAGSTTSARAIERAPDRATARPIELGDGARLAGRTVRGVAGGESGAAVVVRGRGVVIEACVIEGEAASGILVLGGEVTIRGGRVGAGSGVGIMVRGGRVLLESVTVEGARGAGLEVHEGGSAHLHSCRIEGNGGDGIVVGAFALVDARGGSIAGNGGAAIRTLYPGSGARVEGARVASNAGGGLVEEAGAEGGGEPAVARPGHAAPPPAGERAAAERPRLLTADDLESAVRAIGFTVPELALPSERLPFAPEIVRMALSAPADAPDRIADIAEGLLAAEGLAEIVSALPGLETGAMERWEGTLVEVLVRIREVASTWPASDALRAALLDEEPDRTLLEDHWLAATDRAATTRLGLEATRADREEMLGALLALGDLATREAFARARVHAEEPPGDEPRPHGTGGAEVFWTAAGWIAVGDTGPNSYGPGWAAIYDAGGDDVYEDAGLGVGCGVLVVDEGGDDLYIGRTASAERGVALVVDRGGNDRYEGAHWAQATAVVGAAVLWDGAGDDVYEAARGAQAAAIAGVAVLADAGGDDRYDAAAQAQAHAGPAGIAILADRAGQDRYTLRGGGADVVRDPTSRISLGQGHATGLRPGASGGIAILADGGGDDRYDASLFAQGCGYWGALGALVDRGGSDVYLGRQYVQGSGVHGAVGALLDLGSGRDLHQAWTSAQGAGHDLALGILVDGGGNDLYRSDNLTQGSGNANGLGLLIERGGDDVYVLEQSTLGQGYGIYENLTRRWGSIGILLDLGGRDRYSGPGRDGSTWTQGEIGVGVDR